MLSKSVRTLDGIAATSTMATSVAVTTAVATSLAAITAVATSLAVLTAATVLGVVVLVHVVLVAYVVLIHVVTSLGSTRARSLAVTAASAVSLPPLRFAASALFLPPLHLEEIENLLEFFLELLSKVAVYGDISGSTS